LCRSSFEEVIFTHEGREANVEAHKIAKMATIQVDMCGF
jgi:hypothetical protein